MITRTVVNSKLKPQPIPQYPVSLEFELTVMEVAVMGARAFESYWNNYGDKFDIDKHVLCYDIYEEIVADRLDLMLERSKRLLEQLDRGQKSRARASKIYRDISLQIQRSQNKPLQENFNEMLKVNSRQSIHVSQQTVPKEPATTLTRHEQNFSSKSSLHEEFYTSRSSTALEKQLTWTDTTSNHDNTSSQRDSLMMCGAMHSHSTKIGEASKNNSSTKGESSDGYFSKKSESTFVDYAGREVQNTKDTEQFGEPSSKESSRRGEHSSKTAASFYEEFDKYLPASPESSITSFALNLLDDDVHISSVGQTTKRKSKVIPFQIPFHKQFETMWSILPDEGWSPSGNYGSIIQFNMQDETDETCLTPLERVEHDEKLDFERYDSYKTKFESSNSGVEPSWKRIILDQFPIGDFKYPIYWSIDRIRYEARNIADLRRRHHVLLEGAFKKSSRGLIWNNYFVFLLAPGIMLCFRKETLKKVADFRKSTVTILDGQQLKLSACGLSVGSKETKWQMKFSNKDHFRIWHEALSHLSRRSY